MKKKDASIEILRIFAIWAVIMIHSTSTTLSVAGYYLHNIPFSFFLNQISRFAVPLFFLISGYILTLRYPTVPHVATFYKKRFFRLVIPYILWSFIYYSFVAHAGIKAFFINAPSILLLGTGAEHLYFIPSIMLLYFLFPVLIFVINKFPPKKHVFAYFFFLLSGTSLLFIDYYISALPLPTPLRIALLNIPIFSIGILWSKEKSHVTALLKKQWMKIFLFITFLISMLLVLSEGNLLSLHGYYLTYFMSQWRPSILLYTVCIFAYGIFYLKKIHFEIPTFFSSVTFFVFFIHIIFIHLFWKIFGSYLFSSSMGHIVEQIWFDPLIFCFVLVCSYASAFFISRIPIVHEMLGIT